MAATKTTWKLQEFVAHGATVNCLAIGHKSGRVIATGGDDKKVNLWAVGKPNCMMSLSGHTSGVEAVRFGNSEELVVGGSMSGALKIWDLEVAKILRTLTGHKSNIRSLDFHPFGDFVASGSLDSNIKLWDIRRKGCIYTYKGHANCVNSLRFSPDGRWIASASEDTTLKLWDLTAGKMLTEFRGHSGPVTGVQFHPNDYLLSTCSADRTVKFWDLESFQLVSSTDGDSTPIRCLCFHQDGSCLYSGSQDMLKVYGWEPARCFDSINTGWGKVADIAIAQNQLIGATISQTNVSTFVVDVQKLQPLGGPVNTAMSPPMSASQKRRSFMDERPPTQSTRQIEQPKEEPEEVPSPTDEFENDVQSVAEIQNPEMYKAAFETRHRIARSPTRTVEPFPAPLDDGSTKPVQPVSTQPTKPPAGRGIPPAEPQPSRPTTTSSKSQSPRPNTVSRPNNKPTSPRQQTYTKPVTSDRKDAPNYNKAAVSERKEQANYNKQSERKEQPNYTKPVVSSQKKEKESGLNAEDFLPKPVDSSSESSATPKPITPSLGGLGPSGAVSEQEAVSSIMKGHDSMMAVLCSRNKSLQIVRTLWTRGNIKTSIETAVSMNDRAVIVDMLNILIQKPGLLNLDVCTALLPQMSPLLASKYESYVQSSCAVLKMILKMFGPLIKSTVTGPPSIGVDITREERSSKCKLCYKSLMDIRFNLNDKHQLPGNMANQVREIQLMMAQLD